MKCVRTRIFNAFFVAVVVLPLQQARSDNNSIQFTGNQLISSCNQWNYELQNASWVNCVIYIEGVSAGTIFGSVLGYGMAIGHPAPGNVEMQILNICPPKNYTNQQSALVVSKYLQDHPSELNKPDAGLIYMALSQAWPCQKKK